VKVPVFLIVGVAAFLVVLWDFGGGRQVPISQAMNPKYPAGTAALVVMVVCVLFAAWYVFTGQHWEVRL